MNARRSLSHRFLVCNVGFKNSHIAGNWKSAWEHALKHSAHSLACIWNGSLDRLATWFSYWWNLCGYPYAASTCACTFLSISFEELRQFNNLISNDECLYHWEEFSVICFRRQEILSHEIVEVKKLVFSGTLLVVWEIYDSNKEEPLCDNSWSCLFSFLSSV